MIAMSLLGSLRSSTQRAHRDLEVRLDVLGRCRETTAYVGLLNLLRSVYEPMERALSEQPLTLQALPDWTRRHKSPWLKADLDELNASDGATGGSRPGAAMFPLVGVEEIIGCLYVMEGATLGGTVVARELNDRGVRLPHRFFTGYGLLSGQMWRTFREQIAALEAGGVDGALVIDAAGRTFDLFVDACASET